MRRLLAFVFTTISLFTLLVIGDSLPAEEPASQDNQKQFWLVTPEEAEEAKKGGAYITARDGEEVCNAVEIEVRETEEKGPGIELVDPKVSEKGSKVAVKFTRKKFAVNPNSFEIRNDAKWPFNKNLTEKLTGDSCFQKNENGASVWGFDIPCGEYKFVIKISDVQKNDSKMKVKVTTDRVSKVNAPCLTKTQASAISQNQSTETGK